ncbi:MAG TPA: hypothetical protein VMV07_20815 [Streptosporangiaceae bacterium]|nr:hypothetical protein [Streptosporangiaceae bacterium]
MRIPQVTDRITTDRIKEAPTHALRAVFAGIGQLLLAADRIKKQAEDRSRAASAGPGSGPTGQPGPEPAAARPPRAQEPTAGHGPGQARWRSLDQTGNVRLLSAEDFADDFPELPATDADQAGAAGLLAGTALPVPNYDSLSLPSLRARLRSLDAAQVSALAEYERSHAARADVVAMFERRIAKLAAGE